MYNHLLYQTRAKWKGNSSNTQIITCCTWGTVRGEKKNKSPNKNYSDHQPISFMKLLFPAKSAWTASCFHVEGPRLHFSLLNNRKTAWGITHKSPNIHGHACALIENTSEFVLELNKYTVLKYFILELKILHPRSAIKCTKKGKITLFHGSFWKTMKTHG